jgi:hypothetical protein
VPGQGERPVDAGRADLQLVLAHEQHLTVGLHRVERLRDKARHVGDRVEVHTTVAVDGEPHEVPATGP